jgi:hypothetical protein
LQSEQEVKEDEESPHLGVADNIHPRDGPFVNKVPDSKKVSSEAKQIELN